MQTFIPLPSFIESAKVLDRTRLGNQRNEAKIILKCLLNPAKKGWRNHPAVKMWIGYEAALAMYLKAIIDEWTGRGHKNEAQKVEVVDGAILVTLHKDWKPLSMTDPVVMPDWLGNAEFHAAHRSALIRKKPDWYRQFGWTETDDLPYVWPKGKDSRGEK